MESSTVSRARERPPGEQGRGSRARLMLERMLEPAQSERFARRALAVAVVVYATLTLWLTRGASFTLEEWTYVGLSQGLDLDSIATPYFGHPILVTRLFFEASLSIFGATQLPIRLAVIALVASAAVLLFVLVKRRVGPLAALAPAVVLLFLGTTPEVIHGWAMMWVQASAAGLGALVALDRESRRGEVLACALLIVAVFSFSAGVAFAIGAGAFLLAQRRAGRIWVVVVPLLLYAVWWVWALKFDQGVQRLENILLTPVWAADSLAAAAAALTGLSVDLTSDPSLYLIPLDWGRALAALCVGAVIYGVRRRGGSPLLWAAASLLAALWVASALSYTAEPAIRTPDLDRYAYPVAIGVVLVLAASFQGLVSSRRALLAVLGLAAFALPANLWDMSERGEAIRAESDLARARATVIELESDQISGEALPFPLTEDSGDCLKRVMCGGAIPTTRSDFVEAIDRFGRLGYSLEELSTASEEARAAADQALGGILSPTVTAAQGKRLKCAGGEGEVPLAPGGGILRSDAGGKLTLRRFATAPVIEAGTLKPGVAGKLELPPDEAPQPWIASVSSGSLELCGEAAANGA